MSHSTYTKEIGDEICRLMTDETLTLKEACARIPVKYSSVHDWKNRFPEFDRAVYNAREAIAEGLYGDIREIEKKVVAGEMLPAIAWPLIHSKQWAITKFGPREWADRKYIEETHKGTIQHEHTTRLVIPDDMSTEEMDALESALKATVLHLEVKHDGND